MLIVLVREEAFEFCALLGQFSMMYLDHFFSGVEVGVDHV